jgi:hypothetical protein
MIYVTYDQSGSLTGYFVQELHDEHAANHIELSGEPVPHWTSYIANAARDGLDIAPPAVHEPVVPSSIPMLNAALILIDAGYWDDVEAFVAAQGPVALAFLRHAQTMRRDNVLVNAWAAARGKTDELDGLFIAAAALNPDAFNG